jgi:hypothetical protein
MLTYTTGRNLLGKLSGDSSSANLTVLDSLHNEFIREVITIKPWPFRQKTVTRSTETDNIHDLPADCGKVVNITVTIGSTKYSPRRVKTREDWDKLTQSTNTTSNTPEAYFVFGKTYSFYPAPSSATTDAVTIVYVREHKDLSIADYTTGGVLTATNGSTSIVGTGTTWTSAMAGRYLRITDSDTANKGDGVWYEIASVTSATALALVAPYAGTSISSGNAAYAIGQTSIIPEDFQMLPIHRTLEHYFTFMQPEKERAQLAKGLYAEGLKRMQAELGSTSI